MENVCDTHLLEHTLTTLTNLTASLKAHIPEDSVTTTQPSNFTVVDKYAPAQKNELQPSFKRTTKSAGRKQTMLPLV